jgi:hypothetical protein
MITTRSQRWRERRQYFRPAGELIDPRDYETAAIEGDGADTIARRFIETHHYEHSYVAARRRFGFYHRSGELVGVAVFAHPARDCVLTNVFPGEAIESLLLGRLVLLDSVKGNGETRFLSQAFKMLRRDGFIGVRSFSDPFPRTDEEGRTIFKGHIGGIYQAFSAVYLGRARKDTMRLLPDGQVLHGRALAKIKKRDRGYLSHVETLERFGAAPLRPEDDAEAWAEHWAARLTRKLRHPGNHDYAWGLTAQVRRHLPDSKPYPKLAA